ncbi:MAG: AAA-like domain-containing protein [Phormidesmis sp.]
MTEEEALEAVKQTIAPESLSHVQEIVFKQSWAGQLYPEIAQSVGYHPEYIRDVGAQLWRSLSEGIGQKVTKKNVRFVLNTLFKNNLLSQSSAQAAAASNSSLCDPQGCHSQADSLLNTPAADHQLAFPSVGLSVDSAFYVSRSPAEEQAFSELHRPGGLLRIKAPNNMGKTSLLLRSLANARSQGARTVLINMQEADADIVGDLSRFLRWFCRNTAQQLGVKNRLDDYWDSEIGNKISCKLYFREYLLTEVSEPVVLAIDEVDQLFSHPALVQEFLPMLRVWHEEAMELAVWQKLRLALAYSTEAYVPLKISHSPFNIGLSVHLPMLNRAQTKALAQQYALRLCGQPSDQPRYPKNNGCIDIGQLMQLHSLVAGHPYLIQLALYWLSKQEITLDELLENAPTQSGIYSAHLRRHWQMIERSPELKNALAKVLKAEKQGAQIDALLACQLERMGLVRITGNAAVINSKLYYLYFSDLLLA